jgi:protein TonB
MSRSSQQVINGAISPSGVSRRLLGFIALSVAAHGLILLAQDHSPTTLPLTDLGSQVISVTLAPATKQSATPVAEPAREVTPTAGHVAHFRIAAPANQATYRVMSETHTTKSIDTGSPESTTQLASHVTQHRDELTAASSIDPSPTTSAQQQQEAQHNFLLGQVRSLLAQYLSYPPRARRRGWEGEVLVGFRVDVNGRLGNVHLARSSGYSLLDESALAALGRITRIPLSESQSLQPMELQLPVVYQLREG